MRRAGLKSRRIICVGNPHTAGDGTGAAVFNRLVGAGVPEEVELFDGGLGGLNLLPLVEGAELVVFVDTLFGFGVPDEPVVLDGRETALGLEPAFGHGDGLSFLLKALPAAMEGPLPEIKIAGLEAGSSPEALDRLAGIVLELVADNKAPPEE